MNEPPQVIRVALLRAWDDPDHTEAQALAASGMVRTARHDNGFQVVAHWSPVDGDLNGSLTIEQWATGPQLARASFAGADRVDLAARLVPHQAYLPTGLLHRAARTAPTASERRDVLRALGQLYNADDGVLRWDTRIERTLERAWQDPDPSVRLDAAAVEFVCHPLRAAAHIEAALATDPDEDFRAALATFHGLASASPTTATEPMSPIPDAEGDDDGPVVLPILMTRSLPDLVAAFGNATVVAERTVQANGEDVAHVVDLEPQGFDAGITVATTAGDVACVAFSGSQRTATAIGSALVLRYIPVELAALTALHARTANLRIVALRALTIASSRRLFPGPPLDPTVARIIAEALVDPDPQVRGAAETASVLLRDELSAEATHADDRRR